MNKSFFLLLVLFFLSSHLKAQQDPLYNLYQFNQVMINPAYAGIYDNFTLNLIGRKQWVGIEGSPQTNFLSLTSSIKNHFGVGGMIITDQLGINYNTEAQAAFSYKVIADGDRVLAFGVQGGIVNYRYDYSKLNLEYIDDEDLDMDQTQLTAPNFGVGVFFKTERLYAGLSAPRLLNVEIDDGVTTSTRYLRHFYISGGFILNKTTSGPVQFMPSFLWRIVPDANMALDVSFNTLILETVLVGVTYRNASGIGLDFGLQASQRVRIGYAFELPTNSLLSQNYGTHELSLLIEFSPLTSQHKTFRYF